MVSVSISWLVRSLVDTDCAARSPSALVRALRVAPGIKQRALAAAALSLPAIQRMEASEDVVRGHVESLMT